MGNEQPLKVSVIELEGSAEEIGFVQGKQITLDPAFEMLKFLQKDVDSQQASGLLQELSPSFLQELSGLAQGAKMAEETVIQLFSGYNVLMPPMGCSTYANESYYIRNYDFSDKIYDGRLVFQRPHSGYASVGFSQQILGRLDGMNEKGLVIGLHFVNEEHGGDGFLATTICRLILDQCKTVNEAVALIQKIPHRYCYNYSMLDRQGNTAVVEASPSEQTIHRSTTITCTNHFETQEEKNRNPFMVSGSKQRKGHLRTVRIDEDPLEAYRFFNNRNSPLFFNDYNEFFGTLHTVVYCPKELRVIVGVGGDSNAYSFSLKKWLQGEEVLPHTIEGTMFV